MKNLVGKRFGRLRVVALGRPRQRPNGLRRIYWVCECDCGNVIECRGDGLKCGDNVSCGCFAVDRVTTHGKTGTPEYISWRAMLTRCYNPNDKDFKNYGGRGIKVCDSWRLSFEAFLQDMGNRPSGATLDRKDNGKGYSPSNCLWRSTKYQNRNKRGVKLNPRKVHSIRTSNKSRSELARIYSVSPSNIGCVQRGETWV